MVGVWNLHGARRDGRAIAGQEVVDAHEGWDPPVGGVGHLPSGASLFGAVAVPLVNSSRNGRMSMVELKSPATTIGPPPEALVRSERCLGEPAVVAMPAVDRLRPWGGEMYGQHRRPPTRHPPRGRAP